MIGRNELQQLIETARPATQHGKVADYIPALAKSEPGDLAAAIFTGSGEIVSAGDDEKLFTLQSVVKVLSLSLAIMDRGMDYVFERVGMEPTGDPFNSISKLETSIPSRPLNPMINAGALAVAEMVAGASVDEKLERLVSFIQELSDNPDIRYNAEVAESEFHSGDLNRSLCYFMKQHEIITENVENTIDFYTKMCAVEVNCRDLARIGAVLANRGNDPVTNQEIIPEPIVRVVKTFMVTCGMYNASGEFAMKVGIPAKSGVSGAILGAAPNGSGIGIFGPSLDGKGNSVAGVKLMELLSAQYGLSLFA
ncbi:MAG TPA: glutaminase A [Bacillales bacterium]|nr:glutaminase A [Bacillales bacterium]